MTGASGFAGGAVVRGAVARGWRVYAFGRRPASGIGAGPFGDLVRGGTVPYRSWDVAADASGDLPEVDAVIHCAGTVTDWGPAGEFTRVNVTGTARVRRAFSGARFVHVSTASVYDPSRPTVMAREHEFPARRYANAYGASKARAERAAGEDAIVLRPHAVYGPGDPTLLPRVLASVRGGRLWAVGDGRQRVSLTSVGNLAEACLLAASGPVERGVFNVADAEPVVLDDALRWILRERGIDAEPSYLPAGLMTPVAGVMEIAFRLLRRPSPPRLTRYAVGHLAVERTLDISAARERLGYRPSPTSFRGAAAW
ncbi:NAD-dependent epimerase [Sphaerisporangium siamense]|uniref:Nucleoside-diphosphate-sugar epimerase n=1 Tax=Sphaerisporangium siamense TaxID=795645 RepID=A0A7W7G8S3_9ACTN|nr:NAD-dependent epimerase/dehydratase family protein [Sphaerisporangium siamense]MBB4699805.1 nucleoside-diphosphate-sugar epimerase [Sphaerisporangium siamense]GII87985.1 NAD-dependent epimerase [Sphaerisporangium siamense]